ncbi:MAG: threonine synthase, partial [Clostridia bacterium]|nr:threonine synthase [Clostridia bacterium]
MQYVSTRAKDTKVSSAEAIVKGLSVDGGLFVPSEFPTISAKELEQMTEMDYAERASFVLSKFLTDFTMEELQDYTSKAYSRFYGDDPCPLVAIDDKTYILELWHGPTCAFKDMALTLLPHLMVASRKKVGETNKTLILVATSGDTGKAALEGFKDVEGCEIIVFYPSEGVSDMQKLQMQTQTGNNVYVCAIKGNFDDAQSAVKVIFNDEKVKEQLAEQGYKLSSANSINWGRLVPQIAYYVSSYVDLLASDEIKMGDKINFCVPSGNFGNILAGYYAMRMGVPINKLICASNKNRVLTDFFSSGKYDINRDFYKTMSPSMDILISSNLERLLFEISGRDDKYVATLMGSLKNKGYYEIDFAQLKDNAGNFEGGCSNEDMTMDTIEDFYDEYDYLLDTHTAVAVGVNRAYSEESGDNTKTVIVSTASPYKFPQDVYNALTGEWIDDSIKASEELEEYTGMEIPEPLQDLQSRVVRFKDVIEKDKIKEAVLSA